MVFNVPSKKRPSDYAPYLLPEITDEDLDAYSKKADEYENETKIYKISPIQRLELGKQLIELGLTDNKFKGLTSLNNGLRVNRGKTNYDIFYDEGRDTYVVYKLTQKGFTDFSKEKFDDVYVEQLPEIIK